MIFATVGTHQQAFERMIEGLERLPDPAELVVQYGYARPPRGVGRAVDFMSFAEMEESFAAATAIVTHAGVGSILCARRAGHLPIVVPRFSHLGEHVDDHQVELTRALADRGEVVPVWEGEEIADALARVPARSSAPIAGDSVDRLAAAVRSELLGA